MNTLEQTIVNQAKSRLAAVSAYWGQGGVSEEEVHSYTTDTAQLLALLEIWHISGSGMSAEGIAALQGVEADYAALVRANSDHGNYAAVAAIQFALETEDGLQFLRCWNEGNFEAIRDEWPEAPEEVFIGADPLHKPSK
ncbi:hypothetical protein [Pseudomonas sp. AB12(2023)]|uniref:hypothetical protein n=1 Tax=Pseudomonas sp. AB12(2023) TaxID=3048597 RepID=UPI002B238960|nr:hypothetical protein [Pseudomonas sp. AB12(2023)]MEB0222106.1 hypothetical protein [Pseudomonas sp. AB12(2023)]